MNWTIAEFPPTGPTNNQRRSLNSSLSAMVKLTNSQAGNYMITLAKTPEDGIK